MKIETAFSSLSGSLSVPGSKSHTIRACIFAALAEGVSHIRNPLASEDCLSCVSSIRELGAEVKMTSVKVTSVNSTSVNSTSAEPAPGVWTIRGAGSRLHLPENIVDVGNSGSVLYFLAPVAAVFDGYSVFTGDASIRTRPVMHMADALIQLGAECVPTRPGVNAPPLVIKGRMKPGRVVTSGTLSQYVSGIMIAASLMEGRTEIELTAPGETPYLKMTADWLRSLGTELSVDDENWRHITVTGPNRFPAFDRTIPSDWEGAAFPLLAALITDSVLEIENIDCSGSQGDAVIVDLLKCMGADLELDESAARLTVRGGNMARGELARGETSGPYRGRLRGISADCSSIPDAVPALATLACFCEGETLLTNIGVCRHKETDRIALMCRELSRLGAQISEGEDFLRIRGHDRRDPRFTLHGASVDCCRDHRVAMSLACAGLGIKNGSVSISDAECCNVSFPGFFETMESVEAKFSFFDEFDENGDNNG
ncbi:MAG: 3-phosphoshikimate 1-carboxyvinyltransferase [Spirochaetaceae bacterium]|jgi:3-phosphoshikimate 1-carboxyvinyltransferase|nr:3-phosphoshikimate 1-carboxyvinyltransferase [Spirochaetaceae bacterium]